MGEFWTLEGMSNSKKGKKHKKNDYEKKGKDHKQKKLEKKEKKKKKKEREMREKGISPSPKFRDLKKEPEKKEVVIYTDFLRNEEEGLYLAKTEVNGEKVSAYILKMKRFQFPIVALEEKATDYKTWLHDIIAKEDSIENVNKVLYNSKVIKIDIPYDLLCKIADASE